ncbi:hypothetical protein ES703_93068 [subsurface metagenome]
MAKFCPLIFIGNCIMEESRPDEADCVEEKCAMWEQFTGTCSVATLAYLKGRDVAVEQACAER